MKTQSITINVPKNLRTEFKKAALELDKTMTDILLETIKKVVKEYNEQKNEK